MHNLFLTILIQLSNELSNQDEKIRHYEEQLEQKVTAQLIFNVFLFYTF
jgi:hypothetical protein